MLSFSGSIMAKGQIYHLTFTKIFTLEGEKFFIAASNFHGKNVYISMMKNKQNSWKISGHAPMWMRKAEAQLEKIIKQKSRLAT
jgi:hypothetical protein